MTIQIRGILEIDRERGVIYFHDDAHTVLRICSLPKPIPNPEGPFDSLDITHMHGCSWEEA